MTQSPLRVFGLLLGLLLGLSVDVGAASAALAQTSAPTDWGLALLVGALTLGAVLPVTSMTIADWAKSLDPDGKVARVIEMLAQSNEVLQDMTFKEGNLATGHRTTVRTGLPEVFFRLINAGVPSSKDSTAQIDEQTGMMEAWSKVDKDLALLGGNLSAFRLSKARPFIEAMNQRAVRTLFYGNGSTNPEEFTGLSARYSSSTAGNGANVIKAGSVDTDNTSIWLLSWDDETLSGIFPQGSQVGLIHEDKGEQIIQAQGGIPDNFMVALVERWQWKLGIALEDWRYAVRICNIDVSKLLDGTGADLVDLMEQAEEMLPSALGRRAFYMNRTVRRAYRKLVRGDVSAGGGTTYDNVAGKRQLMFGDTPIRRVDVLLNTEQLVA